MVTKSSIKREMEMIPERRMVTDRMRSDSACSTAIGTTVTRYQLALSSSGM